MAMVSADGSSQSFGGLTAQIGWFGLRVGGHRHSGLHSSNEPGELSQWLCHDDSTINIVVVIIIIIIIIIIITGHHVDISLITVSCTCVVCILLFQLWMSFSSIADSTARYFDVDQMQVNWLSIVFMIATIAVGIPAIWIIDHCGLRTTVILIQRVTSAFGYVLHRLHAINILIALMCELIFLIAH